MGQKTGIQRALDKFDGSPTRLAAATDGKVLRQHIEHWLKTGKVPVEKCPVIASASGIDCESLNPDFDWQFIRDGMTKVVDGTEAKAAIGEGA